MSELTPLETLYAAQRGRVVKLPRAIADLYGALYLSSPRGRPLVISNFVSTLDGVISLAERGHETAGAISGFSPHDRMVMGVLRALADVVIVGAGTLRVEPAHVWTAEHIFPELKDAFAELRRTLRKREQPLNVVVSASGKLDLKARVFAAGEVPALVVTTRDGANRLRRRRVPDSVQIAVTRGTHAIHAQTILHEVVKRRASKIILVEGGPQLLGDFFAEQCLDEQFLTLAPQIAGRDDEHQRPSLIMGKTFAPRHPVWGELLSVKRGDSHLFVRYKFS